MRNENPIFSFSGPLYLSYFFGSKADPPGSHQLPVLLQVAWSQGTAAALGCQKGRGVGIPKRERWGIPHIIKLSHWFPFKASLRANLVLNKAFSQEILRKSTFLVQGCSCKRTDEKELHGRFIAVPFQGCLKGSRPHKSPCGSAWNP